MPYYLRLLSKPTVDLSGSDQLSKNKQNARQQQNHPAKRKRGLAVRVTLTCTTDLGDAYYNGSLTILIHLLQSDGSKSSERTVARGLIDWKAGDRVFAGLVMLDLLDDLSSNPIPHWMSLEVQNSGDKRSANTVESVRVGARQGMIKQPTAINRSWLDELSLPEVFGVKVPINLQAATQPDENRDIHVLRNLFMPKFSLSQEKKSISGKGISDYSELLIYEEMGESIARHIWDASLAMLAVLCANQCKDLTQAMAPFFNPSLRQSRKSLKILELGAGCGTVGLGLARLVPKATITLTDLPEAMEILQRNILRIKAMGLAIGTTVEAQVLDWESALDPHSEEEIQSQLTPDLILVCDCVYNPNSFDPLIATLVQLVKRKVRTDKSELDILMAYKRRHQDEAEFFERMRTAGFQDIFHHRVEFPDTTRTTIGIELEIADLWGFSYDPLRP